MLGGRGEVRRGWGACCENVSFLNMVVLSLCFTACYGGCSKAGDAESGFLERSASPELGEKKATPVLVIADEGAKTFPDGWMLL